MTSSTTTAFDVRHQRGSWMMTTIDTARSRFQAATEHAARKRSEAARRAHERQDLTDAYLDRTGAGGVSLATLLEGYAGR